MTPAQAAQFKELKLRIDEMHHRADLTMQVMQDNQSSVMALLKQRAKPELIEEHRNKATFYYEAYLDLLIHIGTLTHQLSDLTKN